MDELADLTEKLVAIPSHEDETAAGDAIEEWLRTETDARVERDDAGSVLAYKGETNDYDADRHPAFVGHHDVVPPADRQTTGEGNAGGYVVERRDGRIYGRGTADMKGAVAACMLAFRDAEPPAGGSRAGVRLVHRRGGRRDRRAPRDRQRFAPERAVVAEGSTDYSTPGVTDVVVAHKGGGALRRWSRAGPRRTPQSPRTAKTRSTAQVTPSMWFGSSTPRSRPSSVRPSPGHSR